MKTKRAAAKKSTRTPPKSSAGRAVKPRSRSKTLSWKTKKLLVPLDFSESSDSALEVALQMARQFGGKITLAHVVEPLIYPPDAGLVPMDQTEVAKAARKRLQQIATRRLPAAQREKIVVLHGNPAHEIAELARKEKCDLLVISTHGYTGLQHVLMGSTAERVVRHAPCPVLVLRQS